MHILYIETVYKEQVLRTEAVKILLRIKNRDSAKR